MAVEGDDQADVLGQWLATRRTPGSATAETLRGRIRGSGPSALEARRAGGGPAVEPEDEEPEAVEPEHVEPEPEPVARELEPEPEPVAQEPEPVARELEPEPVAQEPEPEPVAHVSKPAVAPVLDEPSVEELLAALRSAPLPDIPRARAAPPKVTPPPTPPPLPPPAPRPAPVAQQPAPTVAPAPEPTPALASEPAAEPAAEHPVPDEPAAHGREHAVEDLLAALRTPGSAAPGVGVPLSKPEPAPGGARRKEREKPAKAPKPPRVRVEKPAKPPKEPKLPRVRPERSRRPRVGPLTPAVEDEQTIDRSQDAQLPEPEPAHELTVEEATARAWKHPLAPALIEGPKSYPDEWFKPRRAAQHLATLLMVVTATITGFVGWAAYNNQTRTNFGVLAILAILTLVIWALRISAAPAKVRVVSGILEIEDGGRHYSWDLRSKHTPIEVHGRPGRRWRVWLHRPNASTYVVDSSVVNPREFMRVLRLYRPEL